MWRIKSPVQSSSSVALTAGSSWDRLTWDRWSNYKREAQTLHLGTCGFNPDAWQLFFGGEGGVLLLCGSQGDFAHSDESVWLRWSGARSEL